MSRVVAMARKFTRGRKWRRRANLDGNAGRRGEDGEVGISACILENPAFSSVLEGNREAYGGERGIRTLDRAFDPITV